MFLLVSAVFVGVKSDLHVINCIYEKYVDQVFFVYTIIIWENGGLRYGSENKKSQL
jgi:hypothetical protein